MIIPDPIVYGFGSALCTILGWIGHSLAKGVKELKLVSLIIRTCPGCAETVKKIDQANDHSEL